MKGDQTSAATNPMSFPATSSGLGLIASFSCTPALNKFAAPALVTSQKC
jgi:hypothetical protein